MAEYLHSIIFFLSIIPRTASAIKPQYFNGLAPIFSLCYTNAHRGTKHKEANNMDNEQRQDWWPENLDQPSVPPQQKAAPDPAPDTYGPDASANPASFGTEEPSQKEDKDAAQTGEASKQNNTGANTPWNNDPVTPEEPQTNWNPYRSQEPGRDWQPYNYQQQSNHWNPDQPPYMLRQRPANSGMITASSVMCLLSMLTIFTGASYVFGALGIILALLSRGDKPLGGQAKVSLIISAIGAIAGIVVTVSVIATNPSEFEQIFNAYKAYYLQDYTTDDNPDSDSLDSPLDNYNFDLGNDGGTI